MMLVYLFISVERVYKVYYLLLYVSMVYYFIFFFSRCCCSSNDAPAMESDDAPRLQPPQLSRHLIEQTIIVRDQH